MPVAWDVLQQLKTAKTQQEKKMRLDSITFGIEKGVCIPIHGENDDFAVLLLVQMRGENGLKNWPNLKYELFAAAYQYHFFLKKLLDHELPLKKANLTMREMQCLILTAKQYFAKKIADELKIMERTINFHVQKLNKKLGVKYKHEALLKAIKQGLVNI